MAWLESHQSLRNHPKTLELAAVLEIHFAQAIGHLHCLWWWAMDYAPNGDLSRWSKEAIAAGSGWAGDADEFVEALRETGFLDDLEIHDWFEYAGRLLEKREQNKQRTRNVRERYANGTRNVRETYAPVTGLPTVPTEPTEQNTTEPTEPSAASARFDLREIEQLWFQATGNTIPPRQIEVIEATVHAHGPPAVKRAIEVAGLNNARDWRYVQACLDRWAKGVTSGKPERKAREHTLPRAPDLIVE